LRQASVSALARSQDTAYYSTLPYAFFHPAQDPKTIPILPTTALLNGEFTTVPLIVGSTSNETLSGGTIPTALKAFFPQLTDADINEFLEEYPLADFDSTAQQLQVATGESELICARAIMGNAFAKKTKAWTYRYNQPDPLSNSPVVGHASENWMMFKGTSTGLNGTTTFSPMTPIQTAFAQELIAYWLSFVRSGDPNTFKLARSPGWTGYSEATKLSRVVLQQGAVVSQSGSFVEGEPSLESKRCVFVAGKSVTEQD